MTVFRFLYFYYLQFLVLLCTNNTQIETHQVTEMSNEGTKIASSSLKDGKIIDAAVGGCKRK